MREVVTHRHGLGIDELIRIEAMDEPKQDLSHNVYEFWARPTGIDEWGKKGRVEFHHGPTKDKDGKPALGVPNGITVSTLIAVLIDRLEVFQKGKLACRQNALAITKLQEALFWVQNRTRERHLRGVEGQEKP